MKKTLFVTLLAMLFSGAEAAELPGYDFHYSAAGDSAIKPIQAFDDGRHLYLQFKDPALIPALFVNTAGGVVRLPVHQAFPYLVTNTIAPEILIKFGGRQAIVKYEGGRALIDNGLMTGSSQPLAVASAATIPTEDSHDITAALPGVANGGSFAGELIFNQAPTMAVVANHPAVPSSFSPIRLATPVHPSAVLTKPAFHVVGVGESVSSIAHHWKVSMRQIALLNHLSNVNLIYVGQMLRLPTAVAGGRAVIKKTTGHHKPGAVYKKVTDEQSKRPSEPASVAAVISVRKLLRVGEKNTRSGAARTKHGTERSRIDPARHSNGANLGDRLIDVVFSDKG